jgi:uncharacterized membrane protein
METYKKILNFFDKFEDRVRGHLSRFPILYTFIGGIAIVLFWRGVWHTADILQAQGGILGWLFYEPINMLIVIVILLATGLFVSYFIGDTILLSGLKGEKKTTERTEREIKEEEKQIEEEEKEIKHEQKELDDIKTSISDIKTEVDEIKEIVEHVDDSRHSN